MRIIMVRYGPPLLPVLHQIDTSYLWQNGINGGMRCLLGTSRGWHEVCIEIYEAAATNPVSRFLNR